MDIWTEEIVRDSDAFAALERQNILTDQEWDYARGCSDNRKYEFVYARAGLRRLLSHYEPANHPCQWELLSNEFGKPSVEYKSKKNIPLNFNISHSGNQVIFAFSQARLLGVDIELVRNFYGLLEFARIYFSQSEFELLLSASEHNRPSVFYKIWTLREAFIKALGKGLSVPLDQFGFSLNTETISVWIDPKIAENYRKWSFQLVETCAGYSAAVAIKHELGQAIRIVNCGSFYERSSC